MQFWMKFVNQPILWGLAVVMILIIGIVVDNTRGLMTFKSRTHSLLGGWEEKQVSYADMESYADMVEGGQDSNSWIVNVLTNYPVFSGVTMYVKDASRKIIGRLSEQYNVMVGVLITMILFASVIILTRRSASAIFVLGPLLIGLITAVIMSVKVVGDFVGDADPNMKMGIDIGDLLFNWLTWYGGVGLVMFFVTKALIRKGLVRGIDEPGPLDFSRLQQVAVTATGKTVNTLGVMGNKLHRAIGEDSLPVSATPSVSVQQSAPVIEKPLASTFQVRHCTLCGGYIKNGKCFLCQSPTDTITDPAYGICSRCGAPKTVRAKFCYHCELLFEDEPVAVDSSTSPAKFCSHCGKPQEPGDKFCSGCGTSNQ